MDLSITSSTASYYTSSAKQSSKSDKTSKSADNNSSKLENKTADANQKDGVVYEKSSNEKKDYSATIKQLKADLEARNARLIELVRSTLTSQGKTYSKTTPLSDIFKNIQVDADTIAQAKKDIAEDGYWGVSQTSDRLVSMAQALAGGDKSKADTLINAVKKGFKEATKSWGNELPSICKDTIDSTIDKLTKWRDSTN